MSDPEVAQAEVVKCLQPSPSVIDHVGLDKGVSIQEHLDLDEIEQDDQALSKVSSESRKESFAETGSFADSRLLADAEVAQPEAVECLQPSPNMVDHIGVDRGVSIQENLDVDETGQDDQTLLEVPNDSGKEGSAECHSSANNHLLGKGVSIQEHLDLDETEQDNQALPKHQRTSCTRACWSSSNGFLSKGIELRLFSGG